jgi:hypothetical protein
MLIDEVDHEYWAFQSITLKKKNYEIDTLNKEKNLIDKDHQKLFKDL